MNIQLLNLGAAIGRLTNEVQAVGESHRAMAGQLTAAIESASVDTVTIEAIAKQINAMADRLTEVAGVVPAEAQPDLAP